MSGVLQGAIGILPLGALGVGFYSQLTGGLREAPSAQVSFLVRSGSATAAAFGPGSSLRIALPDGVVDRPLGPSFAGDLLAAHAAGMLPEVVLVTTNPDQLPGVMDDFVRLIELVYQEGDLDRLDEVLPILVLTPNGIFFQRTRQVLLERLEESTLLGRLPDLWPTLMPRLVARVLRGVTLQTGVREGHGAAACYRPGHSGPTQLAGSDAATRSRVLAVMRARQAPFEDAGADSPTRVEFIKASVNLASNLVGMLAAIGPDGSFRLLTVGEIYTPTYWPLIEEQTRAVVEVGRAVRACPPQEAWEPWVERLRKVGQNHAQHVPSSLQWLELQIKAGTLTEALSPTEQWLLPPLLHFARNTGQTAATAIFEARVTALREAFGRARTR